MQLDSTSRETSNKLSLQAKGNYQDSGPRANKRKWDIVLRAAVGDVKRAMLAKPAYTWLNHTDLDLCDRYGTKMSPRNQCVPLVQPQHHVIDSTNPRGALDDSVEDRLHVGRRPTDDAEHFRRCRLMLQRFAQFGITLLQFFEEANVLDSNDRLVGEGCYQLDLFICKRFDLSPKDDDNADRNSLS